MFCENTKCYVCYVMRASLPQQNKKFWPKRLTSPLCFRIFVVLFEEQFLRQRSSANFSACTSNCVCASAKN